MSGYLEQQKQLKESCISKVQPYMVKVYQNWEPSTYCIACRLLNGLEKVLPRSLFICASSRLLSLFLLLFRQIIIYTLKPGSSESSLWPFGWSASESQVLLLLSLEARGLCIRSISGPSWNYFELFIFYGRWNVPLSEERNTQHGTMKGITQRKQVKNFWNKIFQTMKKEIVTFIKTWKDLLCSCSGRLD